MLEPGDPGNLRIGQNAPENAYQRPCSHRHTEQSGTSSGARLHENVQNDARTRCDPKIGSVQALPARHSAHRAARIEDVGLGERFADLQPTSERAGLTERLDEERRAVVAAGSRPVTRRVACSTAPGDQSQHRSSGQAPCLCRGSMVSAQTSWLRASGTLAINQRERGSRVVVPIR